jgi:hypothetical protein
VFLCHSVCRVVFHSVLALTACHVQRARDVQRQQEAVARDMAGVAAQQRRFLDEISRKQQQVHPLLLRLLLLLLLMACHR